jgi:hypothetical protein
VRAQALDAEVEAHAIVVEAHRQTRGPDGFRTRTRQLESHARRDGFLDGCAAMASSTVVLSLGMRLDSL